MKPDSDLLRCSMDVAPADWLDRVVTERVVAQVQRERATHPSPVAHPSALPHPTSEPARHRPHREQTTPLLAWLARLVPHGVQLLLWRRGGHAR
jgi:hypothetical protein